jgi:hypothetical protein
VVAINEFRGNDPNHTRVPTLTEEHIRGLIGLVRALCLGGQQNL